MMMLHFATNLNGAKMLYLEVPSSKTGKSVVKVNRTPKCIWPEGQVDGGRPALARIEELLPCSLLEVPDGLFRDAISKMGIDPTEGETLPLCTAVVLEGVVCKSSIVTVVVEDTDAMLLGKVLKGLFGFNHHF
jgi:hypothetical protein